MASSIGKVRGCPDAAGAEGSQARLWGSGPSARRGRWHGAGCWSLIRLGPFFKRRWSRISRQVYEVNGEDVDSRPAKILA